MARKWDEDFTVRVFMAVACAPRAVPGVVCTIVRWEFRPCHDLPGARLAEQIGETRRPVSRGGFLCRHDA